MGALRKTKMTSVAQVAKEVRGILLADWDPIGIRDVPQARDEYDEYLPLIAKMIIKGTTVAELSSHLLEIERDAFGLKGDPERADRVAMRLLSTP
jgi:hypothetical protein